MPHFLFRDKDGEFEKLLAEHTKYENKLKKFNIISKYRKIDMPNPSSLSSFLKNKEHPISGELYRELTSKCHYTVIAKLAGEYGFGAFDAFSKDIDFLLHEISELLGEAGQIKEVDSTSKLLNY